MAQERGFTVKGRVKPEAAYGVAPGGNFTNIPLLPGFSVGKQQAFLIDDRLGTGVEEIDPDQDVINVSGAVVVPLDVRGFGWWLRTLLGPPVTTGAGPFTHTFKSNLETVVPSLALEAERLNAPTRFYQYLGLVAESIEIPLARSGYANATIQCTAQKLTRAGVTFGGVPTSVVIKRFVNRIGTIKKDGVDLAKVIGGSIRFANNYDPQENLRSDGLLDGYDFGIKTLGGTLDLRFVDETFLDIADNKTPFALERAWSYGAGESLTITQPRIYITPTTPPIQTRQGTTASYSYTGSGEDPAEGALFKAVMVNDVASYA